MMHDVLVRPLYTLAPILNLLALDSLFGVGLVQSCGALTQLVEGVESSDDVEEEAGEPEACCLLGDLLGLRPWLDLRGIKLHKSSVLHSQVFL